MTYGWDDLGNLLWQIHGGRTRSFAYNSRQQMVNRFYSDGTPTVSYTYDDPLAPNAKGRPTAVSSAAATQKITGYDRGGRVLGSQQITAGQTYGFSYAWNRSDILASMTLPSGKVINYSVDGAGRVNGIWRAGLEYAKEVT